MNAESFAYTDCLGADGHFNCEIRGDLQFVNGYDVFYRKVEEITTHYLFNRLVELEGFNTLSNSFEVEVTRTIIEAASHYYDFLHNLIMISILIKHKTRSRR